MRDYIHVTDLAQAHFLSLGHLLEGGQGKRYNLGNGNGYSILEVIKATEKICGTAVFYSYGERRPGDPTKLVGSAEKIIRELGWKPQFDLLKTIIKTAWA